MEERVVEKKRTVFNVLVKYWEERPVEAGDELTLRSAESSELVSFRHCGTRAELTVSGKHLLELGTGPLNPSA